LGRDGGSRRGRAFASVRAQRPARTWLLRRDSGCRGHEACQHRRMSKSVLELTPVEAVACCSPLAKEPLSPEQAARIAPLLKALADPVRLRLLSLVASHADGEACVCDLNDAFDLSQPTISHHLKVLHEVGLLDRTKRGVWVYYSVNSAAISDLGGLIGGVAR
jgi:ArsR family transcriptional regulator, arsenate/arsenite/antimonite-responsive transcriptional repressor